MVRKRDLEGIFSRIVALETRPNADGMGDALTLLDTKLRATQGELNTLTIAVDEALAQKKRTEQRIRSAIARARKELKSHGFDDPALEAEASELRLVDGNGSDESGLRDVRAVMVPPTETPSSIRGISLETLRRAYQ